jgi:hypothetical protein
VVVEERFPGELETLRSDNVRLRRLLKLSEEQARAADPDQATLSGAPESPVNMRSAPEDKVHFFRDLFRCRSDVYALRWENHRDGRSGWMPAIHGYWRRGMNRADASYLPLTADVIGQHLRGDIHIGLYPLGDDDTCWWVAADFDKEVAMLDALAYMKGARAHKVSAALEVSQSGRGAHVWIFFAQATSAATARSVATSLLGEAFQLRGSMHLSSYDRLFPSQDVHTGRGMGNLIAAPLNGKRRQHGTTLFLDPATLEPFDDWDRALVRVLESTPRRYPLYWDMKSLFQPRAQRRPKPRDPHRWSSRLSRDRDASLRQSSSVRALQARFPEFPARDMSNQAPESGHRVRCSPATSPLRALATIGRA